MQVGLMFIFVFFLLPSSAALQACSMSAIERIIVRAASEAPSDAPAQMQVIRKIMEDIFGGTWGVLIVQQPATVSQLVHWTIPDHRHAGERGFCLHVYNGWQYNVFKTGDEDSKNRLTIDDVLGRSGRRETPKKRGTQKAGSSRICKNQWPFRQIRIIGKMNKVE